MLRAAKEFAIGMITMIAAILITLTLSTQWVNAEPVPLGIIPPAEYDHPYQGELVIIWVNERVMDLLCTTSQIACTKKRYVGGTCVMIISSDAIKKGSYPIDLVKRHEIAHCNGWPGDHTGGKMFMGTR